MREAFNSPFWPFVLVTTSVGQEGLDFHLYCHAVVHWNLPSNPVDLEQREGRVHRYKSHAVRKNIAHVWRTRLTLLPDSDPWQQLFDAARAARTPDANDLTPYWLYPESGTPYAYIERHVPLIPHSRDADRLPRLRRALTVYRLAFGQVRQEDLLDYLLLRYSADAAEALAATMTIDLSPP